MPDQSQPLPSPRDSLLQFINAFQLSQCLYVAAELGIADLLKEGTLHCDAMAKATGVDPDSLFRLLRALATAGIFNRLDGDRFELNELSEYLRRDAPGSLHAWAILAGRELYSTWSHLLYSVRTGKPAFDDLHGMSVWEYRAHDRSAGEVFDEAMSERVRSSAAAVTRAYDFARFDRIVDVGGGQGLLIAGILNANPSARGVLFDLEPVVQGAKELLEEAGVSERCETVAGSFLHQVPSGGDAYVLKNIIHDWNDEKAIQILVNCRQAMQAGQILLLVERVVGSDRPTVEEALSDMRMLVTNGGRERTREEYQALLRASGFELARIIPTTTPYQIVEGKSL